jgi:enamine deaminase RidA (YjgF/YER057c/UK114 family)
MARKEVIPVPDLPAPTVPLSRVVRFGELVYVSGTGGRNVQTDRWGDVVDQTRCALDTIQTALAAAGTSLANALSVTTHLKRREDFAAYNEVYRAYFPTDPPTRTTVQCELMNPEMLVEITCIAGMPDGAAP